MLPSSVAVGLSFPSRDDLFVAFHAATRVCLSCVSGARAASRKHVGFTQHLRCAPLGVRTKLATDLELSVDVFGKQCRYGVKIFLSDIVCKGPVSILSGTGGDTA